MDRKYVLIHQMALNDLSLSAFLADITSNNLTNLQTSDINSNWPGMQLRKDFKTSDRTTSSLHLKL